MLENDYFMRLLQLLFESIQKIINNIDKDDIDLAKQQLNESYQLLGNDLAFFEDTAPTTIINYFKSQDVYYLKKVEILARLFFLSAQIHTTSTDRIQLLKKSRLLFEYHTMHSTTYSFEVQQEMSKVKQALKNISK